MAYEVPVLKHTFTINVSSTAKQYYVVKMSTSNNTVLLTTAGGENCLGVIQEPTSSGGAAPILVYGITKVAHDGTLNPGDAVMSSSDGYATEATGTGVYRLGMCLEAGSTVAGTIATMLWAPIGQSTN